MTRISRFINLKGELFSLVFTQGLTAVIKLASSLILTRLLDPSAYGVVAVLFSVAFILELASDVGTAVLLVRHPRGTETRFIHTIWTIRLLRSIVNGSLLFALAPLIATLYDAPLLIEALRWYSVTFLLSGLESMAFILAQREQRSRIASYAELITNAVMTVVVIGLATIYRDHHAFIFGILLQRLLMTIASHFFYRDIGVAFAFDRDAVVEQFRFARVVLPSSLLTIAISQYDKIALLKLFDLSLLGVYGVAGSMIAPINGLILKNCRVVLYARCSEYFRSDRASAAVRYYRENKKLLMMGTLLPAAIAGLAQALVALLYDNRYSQAGNMLMVLGLIAVVGSFEHPSENLLVASGRIRTVLLANAVRIISVPGATLLGYYLFQFNGFLWGGLVGALIVLSYYFWEQRRKGMLNIAAESVRLGWGVLTFVACFGAGRLLLHCVPAGHLMPSLRGH